MGTQQKWPPPEFRNIILLPSEISENTEKLSKIKNSIKIKNQGQQLLQKLRKKESQRKHKKLKAKR